MGASREAVVSILYSFSDVQWGRGQNRDPFVSYLEYIIFAVGMFLCEVKRPKTYFFAINFFRFLQRSVEYNYQIIPCWKVDFFL